MIKSSTFSVDSNRISRPWSRIRFSFLLLMTDPNIIPEPAENPNTDDYRRVPIPPQRRAALRNNFPQIVQPIVQHLKLNIRYNTSLNCVELKTSPETTNPNAMTKATDFVQAFVNGFDVNDALALIRLDDIFMDEFSVTDVKTLSGDNLSRAVGRIAGKGGQIKYAIENATRTRIAMNDQRIHLIGTVNNIRMAKRVICDLVMGSPANKIYAKLRNFQAWQKRQG
ncbi:RNA-binding protein PNO1 [Tritrichomonas foetus]|uniref:RNA-binding protein PNO1 n=1 Tax=Tritrichomonas foetus TaxID=1144522 RepID=A0A1J4JDQ9_9EUKA|nr:RNA-binding protein PNO1 [Tritrichomonas foetus]|eukprot:OHS95811.1 RNA-binding protein PNO1 [Tritrichomonas foetus]